MKKIIIVTLICTALLAIVYLQFRDNHTNQDPRGDLYTGSAACIKCHSSICKSYLHTAHYIASGKATENTVHGSFTPGPNEFVLSPTQKVVMEKRGKGLFQTLYVNGKEIQSHRFDIVLGGVKGESYLYWKGNGLAQLPVSYYSKQNQWLISPGYAPGNINYDRSITRRCLECHASYISDDPNAAQQLNIAEQFEKSSLVYSIDCERCHGPGAQHVSFQTANPQIRTAKFIKSYSSLSRAQRLDMCAVCHSGNKSPMLASTFGFRPGDTLSKFKLQEYMAAVDTTHLDVHGNQFQLLAGSKCFIYSKMDCVTCHDTHQNQRGNIVLYAQKCVSCHSVDKYNYCKMANAVNAQFIKINCIKCHMPALPSKAIIAPTLNKSASPDILVHTHHITIYPQEAKKVLAAIK
jgi:hypothetical protein